MPGIVSGPDAWSPDGRHVVVTGTAVSEGRRLPQAQIVQVATGAIRGRVGGFALSPVWLAPDLVAVMNEDGVVLHRPDGTVVERYPVDDETRIYGVFLGRV